MSSRRGGKSSKGKDKPVEPAEDKCNNCSIPITCDTKALSCNFCYKWVCTTCLDIPDELYTVLKTNPTSHLMVPCKDCSSQVVSLQEMRSTLIEVKRNQEESQNQLSELNSKMGKLGKELQKTIKATVKKEVEVQVESKMKTVESRLKECFSDRLTSMREEIAESCHKKEEINEIVAEALSESKMRERRKANLMMFNIPEPTSSDDSDIKDNDTVNKVLTSLVDMDDIESRIVSIKRLGKKLSEEHVRPIKVVLDKPDTKFKFLNSAYKLKLSKDEAVKNIQIGSDRTPKEIAEYKKLKAELEERKSMGETDIRIRRGKIVKVKNEIGHTRFRRIGQSNNTDKTTGPSDQLNEQDSDSELDINFSKESTSISVSPNHDGRGPDHNLKLNSREEFPALSQNLVPINSLDKLRNTSRNPVSSYSVSPDRIIQLDRDKQNKSQAIGLTPVSLELLEGRDHQHI